MRCREKIRREFCESDRDGRDRSGLDDQKNRPAKKETEERPVSFAQKNILAAGLRHHRRQFRATERAGDRK